MRLLLDEMISWRIAERLRRKEHDAVAVKRDRPELQRRLDQTVLAEAAAERRAVVTNDVRDYRLAHERMLARGTTHYGIVYTYDDTLPRNKRSVPLWVVTLDQLLQATPAEDALVDRTYVLLPEH